VSNPASQEHTMKRELDSRINAHGDRISLVWYARTDRIEIHVEDVELTTRRASVPAACARDAFEHPYLYLPAEEPALLAA
jgi:hypothetical protein